MRSLCVFVTVACLVFPLVSSAQINVEYLYGAGSDGIYLVQVDDTAGEVSSTLLFPFEEKAFYGAAGSGDDDYFWATSRGDETFGTGAALYKVYPAERAAIQIGADYGQNPRHPGDPNYRIRMMELAYDDDVGVLYGTDYLGLYSIDRTTGQATHKGDFGNGDDGEPIDAVWSMGYDTQTQKLIIVNQKMDEDGTTRLATHMYTVDPATAAVTFKADTTAVGMTDVHESHTSNEFFGSSNLPNELLDVDSGTGTATSLGLIADNILGLGGDFSEVAGPQIWNSSSSIRTAVTSYSELDGVRDDDSDNDSSGWGPVSSTTDAFVQEAGQTAGVGQQTTMVASAVCNNNSPRIYFAPSIDFSSVYNGPNSPGRGGGTATITWTSHLKLINDATYAIGDRVIVVIDGNQGLNDEISNYVLDWELEVYDSSINRPVALLTEENVPSDSSAFLAAFHAVVGGNNYQYQYEVKFTLTLDIDMLAGDISGDGKVNLMDFAILSGQWMADNCEASNLWCDRADADQSGDVGIEDLASMAADWLKDSVWDNDNQFDLDLDFTFRSIALPETLQLLNDECADAIVITSDTEYFGSTQGATGTDISSCGYNDIYDVWYNFTPTQNGVYKVHVESTDSFSSCVSVFDSCGGSELHCWAQYNPARYFEGNAWQSYLIRLADYNSSTGDFKLVVIYYPPPANDECSGAIPVEMGQYYQGETYGATNDSTSSCGTDDTMDVWYKYTAADDGTVVFRVSPNDYNSPYYTAAVFDGCGGSPTELACAVYEGGDGEPDTILVFENAQQGHTYYIRIARNDFDYGKFYLDVGPGPDNDECSNAESIAVGGYTSGSTIGATGTDITSCGTDDSRDVWYELTSSVDQLVLIRVSDYSYSEISYTVSVFDSCGGVEQACAESSGGVEGTIAQLAYELSTNETIYIRVAYDENAMGQFDLNIEQIEAPANDECADAEVVDGWASGSTLGASGIDQSSCGTDDTHDVWYTFTPDTTGDYYVGLQGGWEMGSFGGTVVVYDGDSCSSLPMELDCGEVSEEYVELYVSLTASQTYLIRVASDDAGQGYFDLDIYGGGPG